MSATKFDFLIIGGGLSGIQLALALSEEPSFNNFSIGIIESSSKNNNDKTWCFWEKGPGNWDKLVSKKWNQTVFAGLEQSFELTLSPYSYKRIRAIDLYQKCIGELKSKTNVHWVSDKIISVSKRNLCKGEKGHYTAKHVFDSRLTVDFKKSKFPWVLQHFKGWVIKTEQACFNPSSFTMMDYSINYKDQCCFTYVLPYSEREALVEFTFFSPETLSNSEYDQLIEKYLEKHAIKNYSIEETESGVIPMSAYPFWEENRKGYTKIGTGGGWVKASSGYSFKNTEKQVAKIIRNLKAGKKVDYGLFSKRHHWYDRIFINLLQHENHLGNKVFNEMYQRNSIQAIFRFLDEENIFSEELKIISNFSPAPFIRALKRELF